MPPSERPIPQFIAEPPFSSSHYRWTVGRDVPVLAGVLGERAERLGSYLTESDADRILRDDFQATSDPALLAAAHSSARELFAVLQRHFTHFVDLGRDATGVRVRPVVPPQ